MLYKKWFVVFSCFLPFTLFAQLKWQNVDSLYQPLPKSVHVFYSNDTISGRPNHAYYVIADLNDHHLSFQSSATNGKRNTPLKFYETESKPLLVMNCTFFEFVHNTNVSLVMNDGKQIAFTNNTIARRGKDTFTYHHPVTGAIGIDKKRKAAIAWVLSDSTKKYPWASEQAVDPLLDSSAHLDIPKYLASHSFKKWKMQTAVAGGPVLVQNATIAISNNQELKFGGKAINDKHPRTAMGYTADSKLIFLVIEGRFPGKSEGASLIEEATILRDLGSVEALNLDGGGSSCLLVNGKETIHPSDKEGERPVPAVIMIKVKSEE
jgi:hypothetical protein